MTKVLTPLAALAFAFGAQAAIVSPETFDTYTAGTTVISNQTGWSFTYGTDGADDASAVTAYDNNAPASNIVPDGQSAGANYLKLSTEDGTLFRNMSTDGGTLDLNAGLFVDTDVQFTVTDASDSPTNTVSADDKLVIWLEANGNATNLCVLGHSFGASTSDRTDKVYTLVPAAGGTLSITPGDWYRLTVKAVSSFSLADESVSYPAFQVYLNGAALKAYEYIGDATTLGIGQITDYQPYIPARTATMTSLSKVGFSGEGALDSVVVTKDVPAFENPTTLTFTWDSSVISSVDLDELGVSLSASGSSVSVYPGQTVTLTLNGYSSTTHSLDITSSVDAYATVAGQVVTAISAGASTIAITTTAKDTVDVTLDWDGLLSALSSAEKLADLTSVGYTVGDVTTTYTLQQLIDAQKVSETLAGLKVGTNITVTVTYSTTDWTTTITPASCMTKSGNVLTIESRPESGAATVTISANSAAVKIGDTPYASLQEAVNAATSGATLKLAQNIALTEAVTVADGTTITVDLNGKTITGAAEAAVFTNAGALTITDTSANHDGAVTAGSNGVVVANTGTLNLVYGAYTGTFTGTITSITADCSFSYDISDGETPVYNIATGYKMAVEAGRYSLATITYTITYKKGADEITPALTPETYTVLDNVTLPSATPDAGYTFTGWKDAEDNTVTDWVAGAKTGDLVLTAQFSANTYTITYTLTGDSEGSGTAPAAGSYTVNSGTVTLTQPEAVSGYTFSGWYDNSGLTGSAVTTFTVDPAALEAKTFYGKFTQNAPSVEPISPSGGAVDYKSEEAATDAANTINEAKSTYIQPPSGATAPSYSSFFDAKAVGTSVVLELNAAGTNALETVSTNAAATVAANLSTVAAAGNGNSTTVGVAAQPGFYYSVEAGSALGSLVEGERVLATGSSVDLTVPNKGASGFYRIKVSVTPSGD